MGAQENELWLYMEASKFWVLEGTGIVALAVLLSLLVYDICKARRNANPWVPPRALLLNALCLTLLGLSTRSFPKQFEESQVQGAAWDTSAHGVVLLGQSVMMCVFMGYLLPTMGNTGKVFSGDMLALVITLGFTFYEAFMELYAQWLVLRKPNVGGVVFQSSGVYFLSPTVVEVYSFEGDLLMIGSTIIQKTLIMSSMMYLWGLLFCAILASLAIQDIANLKLCRLIRNTVMNVANSPRLANWQQWRCQMLGLCIMARSFNPSYLIARSVLASSTFFAVTISSLAYLLRIRQGCFYLIRREYDLTQRDMFLVAVLMQSLFIICGWYIICRRWMQSTIFCSKATFRQQSPQLSQLLHFFKMENFWVRAAQEIQENCQIHVLDDYEGFILFRKVVKALKVHKLFTVGLAFQVIIVWSSKFFCLFSKVLLKPELVVRVSMGTHALHEFRRLKQQLIPDQIQEFHILKEYLLMLDGESSLALWVANLSFIDRMRQRLEEAKAKGKKCRELKTLLSKAQGINMDNNSCFDVESYVEPLLDGNVKIKFDLQYLSIKMMVVSLVAIMFQVFSVYETVIWNSSLGGVEIEKNVCNQQEILGKCVKAVEQAWQIMSFSENLRLETKKLSNTADQVFEEMKKNKGSLRWLNHNLPVPKTGSIRVAVQTLKSMAEKEVEESCDDEFDCMNWNQAVAGAHMQSMCNMILRDFVIDIEEAEQIKDFLENLERSLASIVKHGVLETIHSFNQFLKKCNDSSNLDESEIQEMCSAMSMVFGIVEEC